MNAEQIGLQALLGEPPEGQCEQDEAESGRAEQRIMAGSPFPDTLPQGTVDANLFFVNPPRQRSGANACQTLRVLLS